MVEGFDFGNSPTDISQADVRGKTIVHTTSAGTQGLTNASGADVVLTGSLVNAAAICEYISQARAGAGEHRAHGARRDQSVALKTISARSCCVRA